jgi:hypothetical protein
MKFTIPAMVFALIKLSSTINTRLNNPSAETPMHMFSIQATEPDSEGEEGEE